MPFFVLPDLHYPSMPGFNMNVVQPQMKVFDENSAALLEGVINLFLNDLQTSTDPRLIYVQQITYQTFEQTAGEFPTRYTAMLLYNLIGETP